MSHRLNLHWVQTELIPFLDLVYNVATGYEAKKHEQWETEIARAESRINTIRNYDDSIITIDRIRLTLTSSPHLEADDRAQASQVIGDQDLVLTMLVRHAITHGPYPLVTLGVEKNLDALREREMLRQQQQPLPEIVKAPRAGRGGCFNAYYVHQARRNQGSLGPHWGQGQFKGFGMNQDRVVQQEPQQSFQTSAAYGLPAVLAGLSDPPGAMNFPSNGQTFNGADTPVTYGTPSSTFQTMSNASMPSPAFSATPPTGYNNGATNMAYAGPTNGGFSPRSQQNRLQLGAPEFVPGAQAHYTLHAPEFVPGAREHATLSMAAYQLWN